MLALLVALLAAPLGHTRPPPALGDLELCASVCAV